MQKKKSKEHNKKRNIGLVYEMLIRQLTKAALKEDKAQVKEIRTILKDFFSKGKILYKELEIYKTLCEQENYNNDLSRDILAETKERYAAFDKIELFKEQSQLISRINKKISKSLFDNFVPNYKKLASIYQIFNCSMTPTKKVILERYIIDSLSKPKDLVENDEKKNLLDDLSYKVYVKKFNDEYSSLLKEQKELLGRYVTSNSEKILEFKIYLNEEIGRIKECLKSNIDKGFYKEDKDISEKMLKTYQLVESYAQQEFSEDMLRQILKIQQLIREAEENDNQD